MADKRGNSLRVAALGALAVATPVGLLIAAGVLRFDGAAGPREDAVPPPHAVETTAPSPKAVLPVTPPALGRADLLSAFAAATDAVANGRALPAQNTALVGREFNLRLPFGCNGPMDDQKAHWAGWTYSPDTRALKLVAQPERWGEAPWVQDLAAGIPFDAAEGFWIRRPWSNAEVCPVASESEAERPPEAESIGLVQFFSPDSPRMLRRGTRPYAYTAKVPEPLPAAARDYGLVIKGRIGAFPDGQPIRCHFTGIDSRPVCLITATFERIAFTDVDGAMLTEWRR